jgi:hypothetical protein
MTEKQTFLSEDDICLYCDNGKNGIYYNKTYGYFFEYKTWFDMEFVFALSKNEAKEELKKLKHFLSKEQIEKCKEIWSDF